VLREMRGRSAAGDEGDEEQSEQPAKILLHGLRREDAEVRTRIDHHPRWFRKVRGEFEVIEGMNLHKPQAVIIELHDERREFELNRKMAEKDYWAEQIDKTHWFFK
jgi:hypothetical protein